MSVFSRHILQSIQNAIANSCLIVDEDVVFVQHALINEELHDSKLSNRFMHLSNILLASIFYICNKHEPNGTLAAGALLSIPTLSSYASSYYERRRESNLKRYISDLLIEFKNLAAIHGEVTDYIKNFKRNTASKYTPFITLPDDAVIELTMIVCEMEITIVKWIKQIICKVHEGLKNLALNLDEFERALSIPLLYKTLNDCVFNASFVEGQLLLLRSHLLTSIYLMCSSKGNSAMLGEILTSIIPELTNRIRWGISEIKLKLNSVRFPTEPSVLNLSKVAKLMERKNVTSLSRMKKDITRINDDVGSTFRKLKLMLLSIENIESEGQLVILEQTVVSLKEELLQCYIATTDLTKVLEVLNRSRRRSFIQLGGLGVNVLPNEDLGEEGPMRRFVEVEEVPPETLTGYQLFESEQNVEETGEDVCPERESICLYKTFMGDEGYVDWLMELRQSDKFKERQLLFKPDVSSLGEKNIGFKKTPCKPTGISRCNTSTNTSPSLEPPTTVSSTNTPCEPTGISRCNTSTNTSPSLEPSTSVSSTVAGVPIAPPLPPPLSIEEELVVSSLQSILSTRGQRPEDSFEG